MHIILGDVGVEKFAMSGAVGGVILRDSLIGVVEQNPALQHSILIERDQRFQRRIQLLVWNLLLLDNIKYAAQPVDLFGQ